MTKDIEQFFLYVLAIHISSFENHTFKYFVHYLNYVVFLITVLCIILETVPFVRYSYCKNFLPFSGLPSKKSLILKKSSLTSLFLLWFVLSVKKFLPYSNLQIFFSYISFSKFYSHSFYAFFKGCT